MKNIGQLFMISALTGLGILLMVTTCGVFKHRTYGIGTGVLFAALLCFYLVYRILLEEKKQKQFLSWLTEHKNEIGKKTLLFEGSPILDRTIITQYYLVISLIIVSYKMPSRYFVKDHHITPFHSFFFSLMSMCLGWWGIPWGPIYTFQALFKNLTGGKSTSVSALIARLDEQEKAANQR